MNTPLSLPHPLSTFRSIHHLSQDDLANLCDITRQIVTNTEAGIYSEVPPSILKGIAYELSATPNEVRALARAHKEWIIQELAKLDVSPLINMEDTTLLPVGVDSFVGWRELMSDSVAGFAKQMKLQPITIKKYETGQTNNLPEQLVQRLLTFGFQMEYINRVALLPIKGRENSNGRRQANKRR